MKVLVLANFGMGLYNFRKELLEELIKQNHEVFISLPNDEYVPKLIDIGCEFVNTPLERRGTNPLTDLKLLFNYLKIIKRIKPDIVLTYTIKPNVYGGMACSVTKTPYISNITGLGTSIENQGLIQKVTLMLYRLGLKKSESVFFQNKTNQKFFINHKIAINNSRLIPGSGVNLEKHRYEEYPSSDTVRFLFIGRIMKAKGINELLEAAQHVKREYPNVQFELIGGCEEDYVEKLDELERQNIIKYHGQQADVHSFIKKSHATILPSYHEGLANVLLESASTGRPVLASNVSGCIETYEDGVTGFGFKVRNVESLITAIQKFLTLSPEQRKAMGNAGRKKVENEFDRKIVINAYLKEINNIVNKENNDDSIREIS
ncbi:glycosyl transferase [[Bacillus] enclensis]|uniref:Galacturonosyltransferase n=1 Tax=[Bacillus] enclensis TaxID=1402860 RepID=A0A0V8HD07_9BACI|nr:glycosyltransferase family 4 protein [[Bacillus] enclensis]KSU60399.1 glycosyl transferase [[Bacillus] enclensis]SCC24075.1 galacturonosyltransferase [[Bacillus] enclensis]